MVAIKFQIQLDSGLDPPRTNALVEAAV